ncbi:MAG TPA: caspase family protein [Pseudomonadales bacterium]|nr:caspase family protein [Pseudomonadales bacterium]
MPNIKTIFISTFAALMLLACSSGPEIASKAAPAARNADDFLIIDCLLPPQVKKLGQKASYLAARRPIKTTAADCEIRGGEYVSYDRANYQTALLAWLEEAKNGNKEAQNYVGEIYEKGLGLTPDYQTAAMWYQKSAAQDFARAQINLGNLYEKGLGVPKDPVKALNLYRAASGVKDDSLEYASSVAATTAVQQQTITSLQQQVSSQTKESQQLKQKLADTQKQLNAQKAKLASTEKAQHEKEMQLFAEEQQALNEQRKQTIETLKREIAQLKSAATQQQSQIAKLETQGSGAAPANNLIAQNVPTIEVMDPPMVLTRGLPTVKLRAATSSREIVGKVNAPSGIKTFQVNGKEETLDQYNLFWINVPIKGENTPVALTAEDKAGHQVKFEFALQLETQTAPSSKEVKNALAVKADLNLGKYYALIIGNNAYQHFPALETAVADAKDTEEVLRTKYGFNTTLLLNANRYQILSTLNELREKLTDQDNLIIYYAGHGEIDRVNNRGHWLPVDAEPNNPTNWISNVQLADIMNAMQAKQILVIADSCYAGTLSQAAMPRVDIDMPAAQQEEWIKVMASARARTVLTSGGVAPVLDGGGGAHSVFAKALLETLRDNTKIIEGYTLYRDVLEKVRKRSAQLNLEQIPDYAPAQHAGHEAGEFFFQPVKT